MSYTPQPKILSELELHNIRWASHGLMREALLRAGCHMSPWVHEILAHQPRLRPQELELDELSFRENHGELSLSKIYSHAKESGLYYTPFQVVASFAIKLALKRNFFSKEAEFNFGTDPRIGPSEVARRLVVSHDDDHEVRIFGRSNFPGETVPLSIPWYFCRKQAQFA